MGEILTRRREGSEGAKMDWMDWMDEMDKALRQAQCDKMNLVVRAGVAGVRYE